MALVKSKEFHPRFFTYFVEFPDGETWVDQLPFIHDLQFELRNTRWWTHHPEVARDILVKGEGRWTDRNSVKHTVKVEDKKRPRIWGKR